MNDSTPTLRSLLDGIDIGMLTTAEADGSLNSRPMQLQELTENGALWFFASRSSHQVATEAAAPKINVAFVNSGKQRFVSVSGKVSLVDDRAKRHQLWSAPAKIWFKQGPDDPDLLLLRVDVDHADYWEAPSNAVTRLIGFATALLTGDDASLGRHGRIDDPQARDRNR